MSEAPVATPKRNDPGKEHVLKPNTSFFDTCSEADHADHTFFAVALHRDGLLAEALAPQGRARKS